MAYLQGRSKRRTSQVINKNLLPRGLFIELGIIGLGKLGRNLALQCVEKGIRVVGKARGPKPQLTEKGVRVVKDYDEFVDSLKPHRVIFLSLQPRGKTCL